MKVRRLKQLLVQMPDDFEVKVAGGGQSEFRILSVYDVPGIVWVDIVLPGEEGES
ncbi:MAG: hypothetical protein AAAC47_08635 [Pararhizobium sp.]